MAPIKTFAKEATALINKCTKPDAKGARSVVIPGQRQGGTVALSPDD